MRLLKPFPGKSWFSNQGLVIEFSVILSHLLVYPIFICRQITVK